MDMDGIPLLISESLEGCVGSAGLRPKGILKAQEPSYSKLQVWENQRLADLDCRLLLSSSSWQW